MKKRGKGTFYAGDAVRIVTPEIFVRCGYDHHLAAEIEIVKERYGAVVDDFLRAVDVPYGGFHGHPQAARLRDRIVSEVAHAQLRAKKSRDAERKLFTQTKEALRGAVGPVVQKKIVKTGFYRPASGGWSADDDYTPAYLRDERTHVILQVYVSVVEDIWIESKHVELVNEAESNEWEGRNHYAGTRTQDSGRE